MNFEKFLFYLIICGLALVLIYQVVTRRKAANKKPWYIDYAISLLPIVVIIFLLRSFLVEPFVIPSQSMEPTLKTGDFILVNKFIYGIKLPIIHKMLWRRSLPNVGDVAVFHYPDNPNHYYIKRIVAGPFDTFAYHNKQISLNGKKVPVKLLQQTYLRENSGHRLSVDLRQETLGDITHDIYVAPKMAAHNYVKRQIPKGLYFVMGDNRDNSHDSRAWGLLPLNDIVGKAFMIWMSFDNNHWQFRWRRIGSGIQ